MIKIENTEITDIRLGSTQINEVYLGSTQVWGSSPAPVLPYDAEVEWLKSDSGGQYIDTGIECTGDLKVRFIGRVHDNSNNAHAAGGISIVNGSVVFRHHWTPYYASKAASRMFYILSSGAVTSTGTQTTTVQDVWYNVLIDPENSIGYVNGTGATSPAVSSSLTTGKSYGLFACIYSNDNIVKRPSSFKEAQFWRHDVLLRDYIAVRKNGVGYLYDKVSGQLFGTDTGSFIIGNDVSNSYDSVVEYISSTDTSTFYIDTGVVRPANFASVEMEMTFQYNVTNVRQVFGAQGSFYFGIGSNGQWEYGYNRYYGTADTNKHTMKRILTIDNGTAYYEQYLDGSKIGEYNVSFAASHFRSAIGFFNSGGIGNNMKVYDAKIKLNGTVVRNYVAVRAGQVGYLFDSVNSRLYGNFLSGSFTLGNDVTN